jgi:hypothetical protein
VGGVSVSWRVAIVECRDLALSSRSTDVVACIQCVAQAFVCHVTPDDQPARDYVVRRAMF